MKEKKSQELLIGFIIILISVLFSLFANFASPSQLVFVIGFLISVICVILIVVRVKNYGISDSLALFLLFFLFYNGFVLMNFSSFIKNGFFSIELLPTSFRAETVVIAGLLSLSALFGTIVGSFLYRILFPQRGEANFSNLTKKLSDRSLLFWAFIFYIAGIVMLFVSYTGVGGFFGSLSINRLQRLNILMYVHTLPYPGFIFVGLAVSFYVFFKTRRIPVLLLFLALFGFWVLLMLLQGDRRFLIYSIFIIVVMWGVLKGDSIVKRFSLQRMFVFLLIIFIGYLAFSFFSSVRFLIPLLVSKEWTWSDSIVWIKEHIILDWFMPGKTEFGAPYFSLLYYLENKSDCLFGSSYAFSIPYLLPRSLYPGVKPTFLADSFAIRIHDEFFSFKDVIKGWGYSPIAEAFQNFRFIGPFFIFSIWGGLLEAFNKLRYRGFWNLLIYLSFVPELLNFNRMCFAPVFQEFVYLLMPVLLLFIIYELLCFRK